MPLEPRGHAEAAAQCRALAERLDWSQTVLDTWPTPLATEYWRVRHELQQGRTMDALLQLKDFAEVLVKMPVLLATRLLLDHGSLQEQAQARQFMLSSVPPTLGAWCGEGLKLARQAARLPQASAWIGPLSLVVDARGKPSDLWRCLAEQVIPWRNEELAHGALKLDLSEFAGPLEGVLTTLLSRLAAHADAWQGIALVLADPASPALAGSAALDDPAPWLQRLVEAAWQPLHLRATHQAQEVRIDFGPYLCLRKAGEPAGVHCYLLNKRIKTPRPGIHLLDYQQCRTAVCLRTEAGPRFDAELDAMHDDVGAGADLADPQVRAFLDAVSIHHEYIPPEYLRHWLADFLRSPERDRGLAWLRGPGDVGKTLFSYGLATLGSIAQVLGREQPEPLLPGLEVLVVPLRKEYRCTPPSLSSEVQRAVDKIAGDRFLGLEGSLRDPQWAGDAPGAFCAWLERVRGLCGCDPRLGQRLLVVLDGLDELPPPDARVEGGSIAELLPPAQRLPEGVFLLATSRPGGPATAAQDRCPGFVYDKLQAAWQASSPELRAEYVLEPRDNAEYRQVLEQFFSSRAQATLKRAGIDPALAFERTLEVAEYRFKWLSHYATLLGSGTASLDDLTALSADPLRYHLEALERHEPRKRYDLIRAILLELAAAQEAHLAEVKASEPSPVLDPQWLGLDLLELARRVGFPAEHPRALEPRFVSALYSVGDLLRSYRGEASGSSRFALGLKGMLEQMSGIEGWGTAHVLWREMWAAFEDQDAAQDDDARRAALLRAAGPALALADQGHTQLLDKETVQAIDEIVTRVAQAVADERLDYAAAMRLCGLGMAAWRLCKAEGEEDAEPANQLAAWYSQRGVYRQGRHQLVEAIEDYGRAIELREGLREALGLQWPPALRNDLAAAYMNRGNAHSTNNALAEAIEDYGRAIELREDLREALGAQWPPAFRNALAAAYMNRGNAHSYNNALAEAIEDHGRAIELREGLREALGAQWPPAFRNNLAAAYMNRGNAHHNNSALAEAIEEYGRAIELMESLREALGAQWPPAFRNDLAAAYMNRGVAHSDNNALAEAIEDYGRAIELREGLREALGLQWPPTFRNDLAAAYMNRGNAQRKNNALAEAVEDHGRAIELREGLREALGAQWPPAFRNDLAAAYMNRGNAHRNSNALAEAIEDYGRAIELMEALREALGAQWPPAFRNALAAAYMNRGTAHSDNNALAEAIEDYGRAIELMEGLREALGAQWPPAFRNDLAAAYMNRGTAHSNNNALAEAIEDFGRAIELMEGLREALGAQWPPAFRNDLAAAYMNRGTAHSNNNALAEAIKDYGRAIELMEGLREALGAQWPPAFRNNLAAAYMNRGNVHSNNNALAEAIEDFGRAIELMEGLREALVAQWPPAFRNNLAMAFRNRAMALERAGNATAAEHDRARADALTPRLAELPPSWVLTTTGPLASGLLDKLRSGGATQRMKLPAALLDELRRVLRARQHWEGVVQLEASAVACLPQASLLHCTRQGPMGTQHATLIWHGATLLHLDGTAAPLHQAVALGWIECQSEWQASEFLRLFCLHLRAENGPFMPVDSSDDLPWLPRNKTIQRRAIGRMIQPLLCTRQPDGSFVFAATLVYGAALFSASMRLGVDLSITMTESEHEAADLPVYRLAAEGGWSWWTRGQ